MSPSKEYKPTHGGYPGVVSGKMYMPAIPQQIPKDRALVPYNARLATLQGVRALLNDLDNWTT